MSIRNADPYVNWIVRYEDGVNSVSPGLYWYLPSTTQFEPYQKRLRRIRKNRQGKPYSLSDPEKNLLWLKPQALPSGGLLARFSVPETKEYELYRGTDRQEFMPDILVDGKKFSPDSHRTGLPIGLLEAGKTHEIEVLPSPYESPLDGTLPMVLYPLRHWKLEQYFIEGSWKPSVSPFGIAMYTGVPTVPLTIEDLITIAETKDPKVRGNIFKKYGIRFFVSDYILRKVFPDMESLFARDPNLVRHGDRGLENTPVYEWRSP